MSELEVGDKYRLPKFISEHRDDLARQFRRLTEAQRKEYKLNIQTLRGEKQAVVRANPKAILKDFDTSFSAMEDEVGPSQSIILQVLIWLHKQWTALTKRCGLEGFYIGVRGDIEHYNQAKVFCSEKAARFLTVAFGTDPRVLALKLESFIVAGLDVSK